jgi:hypothetical protein
MSIGGGNMSLSNMDYRIVNIKKIILFRDKSQYTSFNGNRCFEGIFPFHRIIGQTRKPVASRAYSSTLKREAMRRLTSNRLHKFVSQVTELFTTTGVRNLSPKFVESLNQRFSAF